MWKVMLADDEVNVIEGLKVAIKWEQHGFQLACTAENGDEGLANALENKPELIITDITMPKMDGFEMVERIRESLPDIKVIFLTCHEDFDFAQKAVRLNACDYLIKDTMTRQELYSLLDKVGKSIEEEHENKSKVHELSGEISKNHCRLSEALINELLGKEPVDIESFERRLRVYNYNFKKRKFLLSMLTIDRYMDLIKGGMFENNKDLFKFNVVNIVGEVLKKHEIGEVFPKGENGYIIIYNYDPDLNYSVTERICLISKDIQEAIRKAINNTCTVYIGTPVDSLLKLNRAYEDVLHLKNERFYMQDEIILVSAKKEYAEDFDSYYVNSFIKELENGLCEQNAEKLPQLTAALFEKAAKELVSADSVRAAAERAVISMIHGLEKGVCPHKQIIPDNFSVMIRNIDNATELKELLDSYLSGTAEIMKKNMAYASSPEISKIIRYVSTHLDEDISLDSIAAYVNMNSSYFSRHFKNKTGSNFVDFLSNMRIEKAKELLLETGLSIDEISYRVGHVNKAYFTKVFKKITGQNPGEFRKKVRENIHS